MRYFFTLEVALYIHRQVSAEIIRHAVLIAVGVVKQGLALKIVRRHRVSDGATGAICNTGGEAQPSVQLIVCHEDDIMWLVVI